MQPAVEEVPGGLRDRLSAEMEEGAGHWRWVIKERGEGGGGECVCGCVTAIGTRMGTSVCLHSDELVSELPLERAWLSPMTHSLLYLQDYTFHPAPACAHCPWLWLQRWGLLLAALFLASPPSPPVHLTTLRTLQ